MKTQYVKNIPVQNQSGQIICTFTGILSWAADMNRAIISSGKFEFDCNESAISAIIPWNGGLNIDENGNGSVFCLYY